jgi:hypothetical protein
MINGDEYAQFQDYKIRPSTAAFFGRRRGKLYSIGSGTFVSVGKVHGLLTCAHVLNELLPLTRVYLAIFPVKPMKHLLELNVKDHCDHFKFGPSGDERGPDLGFLRLPIPFFTSISHLVSVKSLETGRDHAFASAEPSDESITAVVGVIDEWTEGDQEANIFDVRGLMSFGRIVDRTKTPNGYDLFRFLPEPDENFHEPRSYGGTSGGGLWRIYPKPRDGGDIAFRLIGVAFYETGDRQIVCHGQASIYLKLFDALRDKWPDAC